MKNPVHQYRAIQASTTDRGGVLLLLYDNILCELRKARLCLTSRADGAPMALLKAQGGVVELDRTLDFGAGPQLAQALHQVYLHVLLLLTEALEKRSPEPIARAERLLGELRACWADVIGKSRHGKAGAL